MSERSLTARLLEVVQGYKSVLRNNKLSEQELGGSKGPDVQDTNQGKPNSEDEVNLRTEK